MSYILTLVAYIVLYQQKLMDHYRNPRNRTPIADPDFSGHAHNALCGDSLSLQGKMNGPTIGQISTQGAGCVISQATASLLSQEAVGKTPADIMHLDGSYICNLIGIHLGPVRLKCALLSIQALQESITRYHTTEAAENSSCSTESK